MLIKLVLVLGLFVLTSGMTNILLGLGAAAMMVFTWLHVQIGPIGLGMGRGIISGLVAGIVFLILAWSNLPLGEDEHAHGDHAHGDHAHGDGHGHGHGHAPSDAPGFWAPWGIVFRLVASLIGCAAVCAFASVNADPLVPVITADRKWLLETALVVIKYGAGTMACLTLFIVASNWSSAQPQG